MLVRAAHWQAIGGGRRNNRFDAAAASVMAGSTSMTRYWIGYRFSNGPVGVNQYVVQKTSGAAGWRIYVHDNDDQLHFDVFDGGGVQRTAHMGVAALGLVGYGMAYDGANVIGRSFTGVTDTDPSVGYTAAAAKVAVVNGDGSTQPLAQYATIALIATDAVAQTDPQLQADLAALLDNLRQGRALMAGVALAPTWGWFADDWFGGSETWIDRYSASPLTPNGAPQFAGVTAL